MKLHVDSRVGSADLAAPFRKLGFEVRLGQYKQGDVWFRGEGPDDQYVTIGIERKNINDLVASMRSGRLMAGQYRTMAACCDRLYLVVEGITRDNGGVLEYMGWGKSWRQVRGRKEAVLTSAVESFLMSMQEFTPFTILRTSMPDDTARAIGVLYRWWQKPYDKHSSYDPIYAKECGVPMLGNQTPMILKYLVQSHGIGKDRAGAIGGDYPTMLDLVKAPKKALQEAYGKVTGATIYEDLRR